jgi:hypothetical protein
VEATIDRTVMEFHAKKGKGRETEKKERKEPQTRIGRTNDRLKEHT